MTICYRTTNESLTNSVYQGFNKHEGPDLYVATSVAGTLFQLGKSMWKQIAKRTRKRTKISSYIEMGYPTQLKEKNLEQITNVYNKLIFPGQYIPHIYTVDNAEKIRQCEEHISNRIRDEEKYSQISLESYPQHCRNYSK